MGKYCPGGCGRYFADTTKECRGCGWGMSGVKKVVCPAPGCQEYRRHHEDQDTPRGPQYIIVPDDWTPDKGLAWCSMTCAMYAGAMSARNPQPVFWKEFLERHKELGAHFHGEGNPPDLILEVKPTKDAQDWLWVYRPEGTEPTDRVKNGMCWEMLHEIRKSKIGEK